MARSVVRTDTEEKVLRNSWEEFQKAEQMMRESNGLSLSSSRSTDGDGDGDTLGVSSGSDDTDGSSKASSSAAKPNDAEDKQTTKKTEEEDIIIHNKQATTWGSSSYSDQMYRSVGAANRAKAQDKGPEGGSKHSFLTVVVVDCPARTDARLAKERD